MTSERYLPSPSWVMPRTTGTFRCGTSQNLIGIVRLGEDGLREVLADLGDVDVDAQREFDIADVVTAQVDVHQSRDGGVIGRLLVELNTLHQG